MLSDWHPHPKDLQASHARRGVQVPMCRMGGTPFAASTMSEGDSCFCGTPQFHIVKFDDQQVKVPKAEAMGGSSL